MDSETTVTNSGSRTLGDVPDARRGLESDHSRLSDYAELGDFIEFNHDEETFSPSENHVKAQMSVEKQDIRLLGADYGVMYTQRNALPQKTNYKLASTIQKVQAWMEKCNVEELN